MVDQSERAFRVLQQMRNENVKPNTATYTCLIDACGKAKQPPTGNRRNREPQLLKR